MLKTDAEDRRRWALAGGWRLAGRLQASGGRWQVAGGRHLETETGDGDRSPKIGV